MSDVVMQLNIVRKNSALYPDGHPQLKMAMARVSTVLRKYFHEAQGQDLVLGVVGESLIAGQLELAPNAALAEFAAFLHDKSVLSLTIKKGLTSDELVTVGRVLGEDPLPGTGRTDLAKVLESLGVVHVTVSQLDYENLRFTEDLNATETEDAGNESDDGGWQGYVRGLLGQVAMYDRESVSLLNVNGEEIAKLLNQMEENADSRMSYGKVAAKFLEEMASTQNGESSDSVVKKSFVDLIKTLAPEPRLDFLKEVFNFSSRAPHIAAEILRQVPAAILLKAIAKVKESSFQINPAILALVDQLAAKSEEQEINDALPELSPDQRKELEENAQAFLSMAGVSSQQQTPTQAGVRHLQAYTAKQVEDTPGAGRWEREELEDPLHTSFRFAEMVLDLFEKATDDNEAQTYAETLMSLAWENLTIARWDVLGYIWSLMEAIAADHEYDKPFLEEVRARVSGRFWDTENISFLATALLQHGMEEAGPLMDILDRTGPLAGKSLVEALIQEDNKSVRGILLKLISHASRPAMPFVLEKLEDDRWFVVRNMLGIIKTVGDVTAVDRMEELALEGHPKVRVEALRALARVGTPRMRSLILAAIDDPDHEVVMGGISVAGLIFDSFVTEKLVEKVKDHKAKDPQTLAMRIRAIKALAEIKDPDVLEELHYVVTTKVLFAGPAYDRIKLEIYRSLEHYPLYKLDGLIKAGLQDSNVEVVDISKRLLSRMKKVQASR
ncbi:MAG: HEAT repeat domain-containing protein [Desulfatibacillum sp.]|nr:HEAT repeat domain-containing protein [Desulfatibacillum sp.]